MNKTFPAGPLLGINNRLPEFFLTTEKGRWLSAAKNVDIDNAGRVRRRVSEELIQAMSGAHSLYMTSSTSGYLVRASAIYAVTLPVYTETLFKALTINDRVCWCPIGDSLYYSNGTDSGRIAGGVWYPLGLPTPSAPAVVQIGGDLFKGGYQVAVSYCNNVTGEEGGISASSNPSLSTDGGLRVALPAATPGATHVNVYVSTVNGSIPMLAATVAIGSATADITTNATGRESNGRFEVPLPSGTQLFVANGRLCSVSGNRINIGSPARPGYYIPIDGRQLADGAAPDYGFITFPENVDLVVPTQFGAYVAWGNVTQFFAGADFSSVELVKDVLPYGAVPGTAFVLPHKENPLVGWFGDHGIVMGDPQGAVSDTMIGAIDLTPPAFGISTVMDSRGYKRVVSCGWCLNLENRAATTYAGWDFTSTSMGYGTKADGLYMLEGLGEVDAYVSLGKEGFGSENQKHLPAVYLGVASSMPMMLRVLTSAGDEYDYGARSCSDEMRIHRVDPGKGLRDNWFGLEIHNTEGSDFTLASVSFAPVASGRRI